MQAVGIVGQLDDTATAAVTEDQFAPVRISSRRALLVEGVASGTAVKVDGSAVAQPVTDNSSSLTVDAPVGTPVFVRLSDGAAAITNLATNVAQIGGNAVNAGAGTVGTGTQRITLASDDPAAAVLGTTSGAKVITDATGTIQQYLRGLVYLLITSGQALVTASIAAGTNLIGYIGTKLTYSSKSSPAVTWTGTSLGSGSARQSDVVDNTTTRYRDFRIRIQSKGQTSGSSYVDWYVFTSLGDSTYTDGCGSTDAAFTAGNRFNSRYLGSLKMNQGTSAVQGEFLLSDVFNTCPDKWGLIGINNSGAALSATAGDHVIEWEGIY